MLRTFVNCAKTVLPALAMAQWVNKTPQFSSFLIAKVLTKTTAQLAIAEGLSFQSALQIAEWTKKINPSAQWIFTAAPTSKLVA
jgi:hypothetical protein